MTVPPTNVIFLRFGRLSLAGLVPLMLVAIPGAFLIARGSGPEALTAMFLGCAVGMVSNWFGTVPVALVDDLAGRDAGMAALLGTALRFLVVLMLAAPLALSGWVARTPFIVWVAISYLVVLFGETVMLVILTSNAKRAQQP